MVRAGTGKERKGKKRKKGKKKEVGCDLKLGVSCCSEGPWSHPPKKEWSHWGPQYEPFHLVQMMNLVPGVC